MKGIVFNQLQEFVESEHGIVLWDKALTACDLPSQGVYVSTMNYDDSELQGLVGFFCNHLSVDAPTLVRAFGEYLFPRLFVMAPDQAKEAKNLKAFLLMIEDIIHVEVRKLYPDASLPEFDYQDNNQDLLMLYRSPRKLCHLSEGLIKGAATHYQEKVSIKQTCCMHHGADHCAIEITFS
ncbi:heme NO-binding domain-containing protein [Psychromonas sp. Urea-02u-13]|uniref:heme NO-binding domain-containing protein n=1 Tax=Psychromonas sp. Urea-02u-13 TaxID=2058326 RepID=UPI0012FEE0D4|nr:heme NO-binding domain-containing protein [Psychromonas sp. Urea-02u-13]